MGLYKKNRTWFVDYRFPPGREGRRVREKIGPSKDEATIVLAERMKAIRHGQHPALRKVKPVAFADHAAEVLTQHYAKKRSYEWAKLMINAHLVPFFGERFLGEITPKLISEYVTRRLAEGVKHGTCNRERAILSKILNLAVEWERIHENPVKKVKKLEEPKGRLRFLTHAEADALIEAAPKHIRPIIVTALETGARLSEILGLKREDVDLDRGLLFFLQLNTKSAKQREIPMTATLAALMREMLKVRFIGEAAREFLFTRYGKHLTNIRTAFEKARDRAGLGEDVTFHTLRHSFASWYAMRSGSDMNLLRELLGHQEMKTTMIYAHLSPDYKRSARGMMGRQPETAREIGGHSVDTNEEVRQEVSA